jgi:hypothetical protein
MNVHALSADSGRRGWSVGTKDSVTWSSPTIADGTVFVGSERENAGENGYLYALDMVGGQEQWRFEATDSVRSSPVVADGTVIFGDNGNQLYAVDTDAAGSSVGSRVQIATQGHLGDSRHAETTIGGVELEYTQFEVSTEQLNRFVEIGEEIEVRLVVRNTGSVEATQTIEVAIEGADAESIEVSLEAGEETTRLISLSTEASAVGEQNLTVTSDDGTVTRTLVVREANQPDSAPLLAGQTLGGRLLRIGGGLALISGSGYALFRVAGGRDDQSTAAEDTEQPAAEETEPAEQPPPEDIKPIEQPTEAIITRADEAVTAGEDARTEGEYHTAIDQCETALGLYQDAEAHATDDSVSEELASRIEAVQATRETLQELQETRAALTEAMTSAERVFREAIVRQLQGEHTVPRLRYRQARDGFQTALRQLEEATQDVFEQPLVVAVETDTSLPEQLAELPGVEREALDRLTAAGIETRSELRAADEAPFAAIEESNETTANRLRAVSWLPASETREFADRESVERRAARAQTGYEMLI